MKYKLIWKTLRGVLEAHKNLSEKYKNNENFKSIKDALKYKIDYIETLAKLMDDLEKDMIGIELNDMEKDYKGVGK